MEKVILWVIGVVVIIAVIYGMYWIAKTFSYWLFYGDMVEQTVKELVKQNCLR